MMQEMTSFTLRYAFRSPEMAPSTAPAAIAANRHTYQGSPKPKAQYRLAPAPMTYWPAAPMLNRPTL